MRTLTLTLHYIIIIAGFFMIMMMPKFNWYMWRLLVQCQCQCQ